MLIQKKNIMKKNLLKEIGECFSLLFSFQLKKLFLNPTENNFLKFCRYALVGGIASIIDWGVLYICLSYEFYYLLGTVLGFIAGLTSNFAMSKLMVFNSDKENLNKKIEFTAYFLIGVSGLLLTMILIYCAVELFKLPVMPSRIVITFIVLFYNYFLRVFFYKNISGKLSI